MVTVAIDATVTNSGEDPEGEDFSLSFANDDTVQGGPPSIVINDLAPLTSERRIVMEAGWLTKVSRYDNLKLVVAGGPSITANIQYVISADRLDS